MRLQTCNCIVWLVLVLVSKVFTEIDFQNLFNLKGGLEKSMGFIKSLSQLTSYSASTTKSFSSSCFYWQKCKSCVARDLTLSKLCHPPIHHQQQPLIDNPSTFRKSIICIMHPNYNKKLVEPLIDYQPLHSLKLV